MQCPRKAEAERQRFAKVNSPAISPKAPPKSSITRSALIAGGTRHSVEPFQQSFVLLLHRLQKRKRFAPKVERIQLDELAAKRAEPVNYLRYMHRLFEAEEFSPRRLRGIRSRRLYLTALHFRPATLALPRGADF